MTAEQRQGVRRLWDFDLGKDPAGGRKRVIKLYESTTGPEGE